MPFSNTSERKRRQDVTAAKQEMYRLLKVLHERQATPEIQSFLSLLELLRRISADRLVDCSPSDFPFVQGEAKAYRHVIEMIVDFTPLKQGEGE